MQSLLDCKEPGTGEMIGKRFVRREVSEQHRLSIERRSLMVQRYYKVCFSIWGIYELVTLVLWFGSDFVNAPDPLTRIFGECCLGGILIFLLLLLLSKPIRKSLWNRQLQKLMEQSMEEMHIPADAVPMELLQPQGRKEMLCINHSGYVCAQCLSRCFVEQEKLCIASFTFCMEIPLSLLGEISAVPEWGKIPEWHQAKHPQTRFFRQHHVKCLDSKQFLVQFHKISIENEDAVLCVPSYELEKLAALTHLQLPQ